MECSSVTRRFDSYCSRKYEFEPVFANPDLTLSTEFANVVKMAGEGLERGMSPVLTRYGAGGTYFMKDESGNYVGVFKPIDEEPNAENNPRGRSATLEVEGLKRGTKVGEGALRKVAAYILDHPIGGARNQLILSDEIGFSGVRPTTMVRCSKGAFSEGAKGYKTGSLQMFVKNTESCHDRGPQDFPVQEVHKIAVLDLRLANADRHAGNILLREEEEGFVLFPIDHGYCLPENFEECTFEWLYWPQARQPFSSPIKSYIESLDVEQDIDLLKLYGWNLSIQCFRTLRISTMLLKEGAKRDLSPFQIGRILCRETINSEPKIEEIVQEAVDSLLPGTSEAAFVTSVHEIMCRYLDQLGD